LEKISENLPATEGDPAAASLKELQRVQPGETVPDFTLVNQRGEAVSLRDQRGKAVLLTFIYTRCPLADQCPLMSGNFAEIDRELGKEPALGSKTHLLSVTLDPAHDTPEVLRSYGAAYTERYIKEDFKHWEFASAPAGEMTA
jgi:protein SCO1/2